MVAQDQGRYIFEVMIVCSYSSFWFNIEIPHLYLVPHGRDV